MEILDWLKNQKTAECQIAHDEIALLRANLSKPQPTPSQSEPVGWQFYDEAKWWNGTSDKHKKDTIAGGYPVRDVYTKPQPTSQDAERLDFLQLHWDAALTRQNIDDFILNHKQQIAKADKD